LHRIVLTEKGRLVLCDHRPATDEERVVEALLGDCRCRQVLAAWREKDGEANLPKQLWEEQAKARGRAKQRRPRSTVARPLKERARQRVAKLLRASWWKSDYRRAVKSRWVDGTGVALSSFCGLDGSAVRIMSETEKIWDSGGKIRSGTRQTVGLVVPWRRYAELRKAMGLQGMAGDPALFRDRKTGNDHLPLAIAPELMGKLRGWKDGDLSVVSGKQGRGLSIDTRDALIRRDEDGEWFLVRWL